MLMEETMFVLVADQRASRKHADLVASTLGTVAELAGSDALLPPERTVGDELQILLGHADTALRILLALTRTENWSVGIGIGEVESPLPPSVRSARGPAFIFARDAVERAKKHSAHAIISGRNDLAARDATALLAPLLDLRARRSDAGWEVWERLSDGLTQERIAQELGITQAAVSKRARAAGVTIERDAVPALERLIATLDREN